MKAHDQSPAGPQEDEPHAARYSQLDHDMMARALGLAQRGLYTTTPNPRVGCVLTRGAEVVGEGWHRKAGEPHAEIHALREAAGQAEGATAYVTLEPCSHQGRTPPCVEALIAAGIARVVCAVTDPNPKVNGKGIAELRRAGIRVDVGLMEEAARTLNKGFFKRMVNCLPWVTVKIAASLDGRVALANGASRWITSEDSRRDVQRLRARSCAIVTGVGTVVADDPRLTVRPDSLDESGVPIDMLGRQPLRAVCDAHARTPPGARLLQEAGRTLIYVVRAEERTMAALRTAGAEVVCEFGATTLATSGAPGDPARIDLRAVLIDLARRECNEVLIEAGPRLAASFVAAKLADELVIYMAPVALGADALGMLPLPKISQMIDRRTFAWEEVRRIGPDLKLTLRDGPIK